MKSFIKIIPLLLCSFHSISQNQKPPVKFGDIPLDQLSMKIYQADTSASAVILTDFGESIIQYDESDGFVLQFERLTRIKILTKDGLDWANFSIPLYHDGSNDEKVTILKGITYNLENGKVSETKLKNDAIFREKQDANFDITKVTMPNVKVGSVIEINYKVKSDFIFNFQDWEFQSTIPTLWSEYRARIPEYFTYDKYMQGYVKLVVNENSRQDGKITVVSKERSGYTTTVKTTFDTDEINFQENRFRWAAENVPAFKPEPFITTARDYMSKINFELVSTQYPNRPINRYMGSWEDINKQFAESSDFLGEITGNGFLKKIVEDITAGKTTPEEKIAVITSYVKQNVVWDETSRRLMSKSLKKVLEDKKGSSAEINFLLASMLDKADIKVSPVLLSTRDHGFVRETTPISSQFNYVICMATVGDKSMLLDGTERLLPVGALPERCLNGRGFVVSKEGFNWVNLQAAKSKTTINGDLLLAASGDLKGKLQIDRVGYDALASRKRYLLKNEQEYVKDFLGGKSWDIVKTEITNAQEIDQPLKEVYALTVNEHVVSTPEALYFNPLLLQRMDVNPFKLEAREYPVDYGSAFERMYMCRITIPEGYVVDELPKSKVLALPANAGKFTYSINQTGSILNIVCNFQINQSLFSQLDYPNLREFYNQVVAKQAEQVVLKKKL
jgi:hypothetical protein